MATNQLQISLLRPPILHILRAAGFTTTRPAVLDTVVDLASRYLILVASHAARHAVLHTPDLPSDTITITDVRMALRDAGALHAQISEMEEQSRGEEDLRGVEAFIAWCKGEAHAEIRRIAGLAPDTMDGKLSETESLNTQREDFLAGLKKKHSKTGEESRYQGTALGKDAGEKEVTIEGGEVESIQAWGEQLRIKARPQVIVEQEGGVRQGRSESGSPLTEISGTNDL